MFDVAAEAYDRFMGRFSQPLADPFADWAGIEPGQRVLDVGCGPGALTAVLADRLGADAVAAVDPSASFVAAARTRVPGVDVRRATAEALPFDDDAFDAALAELVVHFMADPARGLSEMQRVTRPGGTVAACVWDFGGERAPQAVFFRAASVVLGRTVGEQDRAGAHAGQLEALLADAGCGEVEGGEITVRSTFPSIQEWWEPYTLGVSPAGALVASLDAPTRARILERARVELGTGPVTVTATAWVARGRA